MSELARLKIEEIEGDGEALDSPMTPMTPSLIMLELELWKSRFHELEKQNKELRLKLFQMEDSQLKIGEKIGQGSISNVFDGEWEFKKSVAVKEVKLGPIPHEAAVEEFLKQVSLIHKNILRIHGFSLPDPKTARIVMEKMGGDLEAFTKKNELTLDQKLDFMKQMVDAIHYLHGRSSIVLHNNLKPSEFLVSLDGKNIKLSDFVHMIIQDGKDVYSTQKFAGSSWECVAPEVVADPKNAKFSVYSDVFGLAVTFWMLLHEKFQWSDKVGSIQPSVAYGGLLKDKKRPEFDEDCPKELQELIGNMWTETPESRLTSMELIRWMVDNLEGLKKKYAGVRFPKK